MRWLTALMAVLLTAGALAEPALARQGTGLYAPFPSPPAGARAERFVGELGIPAKKGTLLAGRTTAGSDLAPSASGPSSRRSGADGGAGSHGALLAVVTVGALLGVSGLALAAQRARRAAAARAAAE